VLLVLLCHTTRNPADNPWYFNQGGFGVSIFFGLSGLLVCRRLVDELEVNNRISIRGFYIRRAFRILPPAWAYLAVLAILAVVGLMPRDWPGIRASLLVYRNYIDIPEHAAVTGYYTSHFWSLAVEEHFYLFFPLLLILVGPRRACWVFPLLATTLVVWRVLDVKQHWVERWTGLDPGTSYSRSDYRMDALLWGCWAGVLLWRFGSRWNRWAIRAAGLLAAALLIQGLSGLNLLHSYVTAWLFPGAFIPVVLMATTLCPRDPLSRVLEWGPIRWLGRLSYSIYLWQMLFCVMYAEAKIPALGPLQQWPWNWGAVLGCACVSYYLLERPLTRLGHRLARPATLGREGRLPEVSTRSQSPLVQGLSC
jgi:peptidoglycan/LPS O-acetylase OafA/YrhL